MVFRDSLFSSFWGGWHGQGSLWGSTGGSGWCLSCSSSLLCLGAWVCCRLLRAQQVPAQAGASPGAPQVGKVSFAACLTLALLRARTEQGHNLANQGSCLCPPFYR